MCKWTHAAASTSIKQSDTQLRCVSFQPASYTSDCWLASSTAMPGPSGRFPAGFMYQRVSSPVALLCCLMHCSLKHPQSLWDSAAVALFPTDQLFTRKKISPSYSCACDALWFAAGTLVQRVSMYSSIMWGCHSFPASSEEMSRGDFVHPCGMKSTDWILHCATMVL